MASGTHAAVNTRTQTLAAPPLTAEEEDAVIHTRITNDEKALRRVIKKFHTFSTAPGGAPASDDARDAFLLELASFELSLKKGLMVCEAEARQVEEYDRERQRIADEHIKLRGQIDQLKTSLEHAQMFRKRKIEYDVIADKVNALPSRDELMASIESLESDMAAIQSEHETQDRVMQAQKAALHTVVTDIASLRLIGKDPEAMETEETISEVLPEEKEDGEEDGEGTSTPLAAPSPVLGALNPSARPFIPGTSAAPPSRTTTPVGPQSHAQRRLGLGTGSSTAPSTTPSARPSPRPPSPKKASTDDDVEMGEVAEQRVQKRKGRDPDEELEEGEATDSELSSSELSEPPED